MMKAGSTMFARAARQVVRHHCGCCGDELTAHQALSSGICDKPRCREWKIAKVGADLLERRRRETLERLFEEQSEVVERAAAAIRAAPETVVRATIPWQGNAVARLSEDRWTEFAEHLRTIVAEAFARPIAEGDLTAREASEREEAPITATACAACRGQCCSRGGTTAFLQAEDIARWRQRAPAATADEIAGWYLARLPEETIEETCVFQSATGCTLPRERRSDRCNTFYCKQLQALHHALGGDDDKVVMIVDDEAADEARGVVGWSAATGPVGFRAVLPEPEGNAAS